MTVAVVVVVMMTVAVVVVVMMTVAVVVVVMTTVAVVVDFEDDSGGGGGGDDDSGGGGGGDDDSGGGGSPVGDVDCLLSSTRHNRAIDWSRQFAERWHPARRSLPSGHASLRLSLNSCYVPTEHTNCCMR